LLKDERKIKVYELVNRGNNYELKEKELYLHNHDGELWLSEVELGHMFYSENASQLGKNSCRYKLTPQEVIQHEINKQQSTVDRFQSNIDVLNKILLEVV